MTLFTGKISTTTFILPSIMLTLASSTKPQQPTKYVAIFPYETINNQQQNCDWSYLVLFHSTKSCLFTQLLVVLKKFVLMTL